MIDGKLARVKLSDLDLDHVTEVDIPRKVENYRFLKNCQR